MARIVTDTQAEAVEYAAEIFETYGPLAAGYAMLYKHCLEVGQTERIAEHYVCAVIDAMK